MPDGTIASDEKEKVMAERFLKKWCQGSRQVCDVEKNYICNFCLIWMWMRCCLIFTPNIKDDFHLSKSKSLML